MNKYTWVISQLDCYPTYETRTDVVSIVHWRRQATDGTYLAEIYGSQLLMLGSSFPFIPYGDLTEAQVIAWLETSLGEDELTKQISSLDGQLKNLANPSIAASILPWAK